jgi:hypothetical protein
MNSRFYTKTQALALIGLETGFGRRVIEKIMNKLVEKGRIKVLDSPDVRALWISRADVDLIIQALKGEIEVE